MPVFGVTLAAVSFALALTAGGVAVHEHSVAQQSRAQLAAARQAADDQASALSKAEEDRDAAQSKTKNLQASVDRLMTQVSTLAGQVVNQPAPEPAAVPVAAAPAPVLLTDSTALANYLWSACRAAVGAGATDPGKAAFVTYFHGLERQQGQERAAGRTYYQPDPVAQAAEYAHGHAATACY